MAEWVKILILGVCLFAFVVASYRVMVGQRKGIKEQLLKAYGYELDGDWWKKPGYSIQVETVENWSVGRLIDYLERWKEIEERKKEEEK